MEIFLKIQFFQAQVHKGRQKAGPHIKEIQAVKAVGHHQKIAGQGIGP